MPMLNAIPMNPSAGPFTRSDRSRSSGGKKGNIPLKQNRYTGFHHLAFVTADMDATIRFWRDLLGMRLVYTQGRPGYRQYFFQVAGSSLISFFEWPDAERVGYRRHGEAPTGPREFDHISIGVASREALVEIGNALAEADFPVSDVIDHGFILSIYAYDPNHIPIEFSCDVPGIDVCARPVMRDEAPSATALEGPEPVPDRWPRPAPPAADEWVTVDGEGKEHF